LLFVSKPVNAERKEVKSENLKDCNDLFKPLQI